MVARKLPPDSEVLRLWLHGLKQHHIAKKYGVSAVAVSNACLRARGIGWAAGKPLRDYKVFEPNKTYESYETEALETHDCADLLREWGAQ